MHVGPYRVLLDKRGILSGVTFPTRDVAPAEQTEELRRTVVWFWHDLQHHFMTPIARGQLWSAYGALDDLRRACVNLARMSEDFTAEAEGYEVVERALPIERLAPLAASCCPLERDAMLQAARVIVRFYEQLAPALAQAHGIAYPAELARMMSARLESLG
jgi:hypothetical protein